MDRMQTVYLLGGMLNNDNYGDFIQAKVWIDWYRAKGFTVFLVCNDSLVGRLKGIFLGIQLSYISPNAFLTTSVSSSAVFHLYGGGYLNKRWGAPYIALLKRAHEQKMKIYATGIQIDETYVKDMRELSITYCSVRDLQTQRLLETSAPLCDDSFGYFAGRLSTYHLMQKVTPFFTDKKIVLQLSLNEYVVEQNKDAVQKMYTNGIEQSVAHANPIQLISSFPKGVADIFESERLLAMLSLPPAVKKYISMGTTRKMDADWFMNPRIIIATSFHTYLLSVFKYRCPVYYLVFSPYYKQKAEALLSYGLIEQSHIINSLEILFKQKSQLDLHLSIQKNISMFYSVQKQIQLFTL
jgi:hypothetical protein